MHADYHCTQCETPASSVDSVLHAGCGYREWQKAVVIALEQTVGKQIKDSLDRIEAAKNVQGACHSCGVCCSLASSQFSYQELLDKAKAGDYFAQQFTSVFLPYESHAAAQAKYPELVTEIIEQAEGDVHFYQCPYLSPDNKCSIYNDPKRPQICADYPETPLILMYKKCGYQPWKTEMLPTTLLAHASLELCQHYANKILESIKNPGE
jgi:Fe-S-cluster containining protein